MPTVKGRDGKPLRFRARGLSPDESNACERRSTKRVRRENGRWEQEIDSLLLMCETILAATLPEDRKRLWDNARMQQARKVATARDLVRSVFKLKGDLIRAYNTVEGLSDSSVQREAAYKSGD